MAEKSVAHTATAPSESVKPGLDELRQTLASLGVEKWKLPKVVRDSTVANVGSIRRDIDATLPGLLAAADGQPDAVSAMLPVAQNLGALYDVLLRVTVVADAAAPQDQTSALEHSMTSLEGVRRQLGERLQRTAEAQEKKAAGLQKALSAAQAAPAVAAAPAAAPCPAAAPAKKKPAKKPAAPATGK